jgi:hypothetical protein
LAAAPSLGRSHVSPRRTRDDARRKGSSERYVCHAFTLPATDLPVKMPVSLRSELTEPRCAEIPVEGQGVSDSLATHDLKAGGIDE